MNLLKGLLWICGIIFFVAFPMMVVSWDVVSGICKWFGLPLLPADAMTVYAYRVTCALCGVISLYFMIMASDPLRYLKLVRLTGWGMIFVGLVAIGAGIFVNMKPPWYIAEGGFGVLIGLLILVLHRQVLMAGQAPKTSDSKPD